MKTHKMYLKKVSAALGDGAILHHKPTTENPLGQSGLHTFIDDIVTIAMEDRPSENEIARRLRAYLSGNDRVIK